MPKLDEFDREMHRAAVRAAEAAQKVAQAAIEEWDITIDYEIIIRIRTRVKSWEHRIATHNLEDEDRLELRELIANVLRRGVRYG